MNKCTRCDKETNGLNRMKDGSNLCIDCVTYTEIDEMLTNLQEEWNDKWDDMSDWETEFITDMSDKFYDKEKKLTKNQYDKLVEIYNQYVTSS